MAHELQLTPLKWIGHPGGLGRQNKTGSADAEGGMGPPKRLDFTLSQRDKIAVVEAGRRLDSFGISLPLGERKRREGEMKWQGRGQLGSGDAPVQGVWQKRPQGLQAQPGQLLPDGLPAHVQQVRHTLSHSHPGKRRVNWRLHKAHPPTYETGTQRLFHLGRTETIRLPSMASVDFVTKVVPSPASRLPQHW